MNIRDLIPLSRQELYEIAQERDISGRGTMSKADFIIALADPTPSEHVQELVNMGINELKQLASEKKIKGRSGLSRDELLLALLPKNETKAKAVIAIRWPRVKGEVIGYCIPERRPGVMTDLFYGLRPRLMDAPPAGAEVRECPL